MKLATTWTQLGLFEDAAKQYESLVEKGRQRIVDQGRTNSARGNLALILKQYAELLRLKLGKVPEAEQQLVHGTCSLSRPARGERRRARRWRV